MIAETLDVGKEFGWRLYRVFLDIVKERLKKAHSIIYERRQLQAC